MSNFKLAKMQYSFLETVTSSGTLTLSATSALYHIFTGVSNHNLRLPDATTSSEGINFVVINESTGNITIQNDSLSTVAIAQPNSIVEVFLSDNGSSDGVWSTYSGGGTGSNGIFSQSPDAPKTSNYTILGTDQGGTILVDTSAGPLNITLPSPTDGFNITIQDAFGTANQFPITILRDSDSTLIDQEVNNDIINKDFGTISYISDGTDWFRVSSTKSQVAVGLIGGGSTGTQSNVIDYINLHSINNATDFGDLTVARDALMSCSSSIRGIFSGGDTGAASNIIDYVTIAAAGNATDFGDLTIARSSASGCGSQIRGLFAGGGDPGSNVIDYITIASAGNATDFGDLTVARQQLGACASPVRAVFGGGNTNTQASPTESNVIDYVTIASVGNATDFGDLTVIRMALSACSNQLRGLFMAGTDASDFDTIDYITIASTGNATDFGNLTAAKRDTSSFASKLKAACAGGFIGAAINVIDFVMISNLGNATDFGDLTVARSELAACSSDHGGLNG